MLRFMRLMLRSIITVVLASLFSVGIVSSITGRVEQEQFSDVMLQSQSSGGDGSCEYQDQGLISPDGGCVYINNDQGELIATVSLDPGFLKESVLVNLNAADVFEENGYEVLRRSDRDTITPIGPKVTVEFPFNAIDLESRAYIGIFVFPYEGVYDESRRNAYYTELLTGDDFVLTLGQLYSLQDLALGNSNDYNFPAFTNNPPETYRFSAQPVTTDE